MDRTRLALLIAAAGAAGALSRWGLGTFITARAGERFPWGTLVVNALGCFLLGVVLTVTRDRYPGLEPWRPVLAIGFLGAFTTFATYVFEADALLSDRRWLPAAAYILGSVALGLGAFRLGIVVAR